MRATRGVTGLRALLAAAALAVLGICAGAAVPATALAHDDDNGGGGGGGTFHQCSGTKLSNTPTNQNCLITAPTGTCIQSSSAPTVVQRCTFTQSSAAVGGTTLRATAIQIHNPEGGPSGTQDAIQVIEASQTNLSPGKSDFLYATQIADQCLGSGDKFEDRDGDLNDEDHDGDRDDDGACEDSDEEDGDDEEEYEDEHESFVPDSITQSQRATQTIDAYQKTVGTGKDVAEALQVQNLHERAANAEGIFQDQNFVQRANECGQLATGLVDFLDANACFSIKQDSDQAKSARLLQVYNLFQSARNATLGGSQDQGDLAEDFGGLEHSFDLTGGTGTPTQSSNQVERLTQRRVNTPGMLWHQFAGPRKGTGLMDDPGARAIMNQDVKVFSTGPGFGGQGAFLEIFCVTPAIPGDPCRGTQRAQLNDASYSDSQSGSSIFMTARCEETEGGQVCAPVGD